MTDILTPEQAEVIKNVLTDYSTYVKNASLLHASHEALRTDRDSWKATAEELGDKNVNKAFQQRHEMREAGLRKQLTEAQATTRILAAAIHNYLAGCPENNWRGSCGGGWPCVHREAPLEAAMSVVQQAPATVKETP